MTPNGRPGRGGASSVRPAGTGGRRAVAWLVPVLLTSLAGCGRGKGDVSGEVTYNGQPLPLGRVTFVSEVGKKEAVSGYVVRGKYTVKGCPAGPAKVSVESLIPPDPETLKGAAKVKIPMAGGMKAPELPPEIQELAAGERLKYVPIPLDYANPETSGLSLTVSRGSQTYNIPLGSK